MRSVTAHAIDRLLILHIEAPSRTLYLLTPKTQRALLPPQVPQISPGSVIGEIVHKGKEEGGIEEFSTRRIWTVRLAFLAARFVIHERDGADGRTDEEEQCLNMSAKPAIHPSIPSHSSRSRMCTKHRRKSRERKKVRNGK